jgi:hypothetical protein
VGKVKVAVELEYEPGPSTYPVKPVSVCETPAEAELPGTGGLLGDEELPGDGGLAAEVSKVVARASGEGALAPSPLYASTVK